MGIAWCRERVEQAQNSKSPVDRILIRCSNVIKPKTSYSRSQDKLADDIVYKGMRSRNLAISPPVPIHAVPPRTRRHIQRNSDWQNCSLKVPDEDDPNEKAPIPPPRKKRKRRVNSLHLLNAQLQLMTQPQYQPSYTIYSENLLNQKGMSQNESENEENQPLSNRNHNKEKRVITNEQKRPNRFIKSSESKGGKIKTGSYSMGWGNDVKDEKVKNDNRKKTEQKIKVVKNVSTVSLPNYNELVKPAGKVSSDVENSDDKTGNQSGGSKPPRRNASTISLPGEGSNSILTSLSEATIHRLETYMKRCRSFGSLKPQQLVEKLEEFKKTYRSTSESEDSWSGLDDWDLGVIEYCDPETPSVPPYRPKSTLPVKQEKAPLFTIDTHEDTSLNQTLPDDISDDISEDSKMLPEKESESENMEQNGDDKKLPHNNSEPSIDHVPTDWFTNAPEMLLTEKKDVKKDEKSTKTPPPSPENGIIEPEKTRIVNDESSLLKILREYKDEEKDEADTKNEEAIEEKENTFDTTQKNEIKNVEKIENEIINSEAIPIPPRRRSKDYHLRKRKRSQSLQPKFTQDILTVEKYKNYRSPSISYDKSTSLLEELTKNRKAFEEEFRSNPRKIIKGLKEECLYQSLPEDAFEIFISRKKPSLRESLSEFLGFEVNDERNQDNLLETSPEKILTVDVTSKLSTAPDESELDNRTPPPLPASPPPSLTAPPVELAVLTTSPNSLVKISDQKFDNDNK